MFRLNYLYDSVLSWLALIYRGNIINQTSVAAVEPKQLIGRCEFILAASVLFWVMGGGYDIKMQSWVTGDGSELLTDPSMNPSDELE